MARKTTWITAGLLSAAAAGAGALMAWRRRHATPVDDQLAALSQLPPHADAGKHKKERVPRKLKKHRAHEALATGHGGQHW